MNRLYYRAGLACLMVFLCVMMIGVSVATMPAREDDVLWSQTFAGNGSHNCLAIARTADGGYILGGLSADSWHAYTARADANGSLLWENNSLPGSVTFYDVAALPDGSFVFAGAYGGIPTNSSQQGFLLKTDADGRQIFARTYSQESNMYFFRVLANDDGSLVLLSHIGNLTPEGEGGSYIYLLKTDAVGNVLWSDLYGGNNVSLNCNSMVRATDGGYVIAGNIYTVNRTYTDAYLLKIDGNGNKLWDARYPDTGFISINSLCIAGNDGYLLAGDQGGYLYLNRVTSNGTSLWNRAYDVPAAAHDVIQASDGGFVLACGHNITKVSGDGVTEWERDFGAGNNSLNCVAEAADGSYVFGGYEGKSDGTMATWLVDIGNTKGPGATGGCLSLLVFPLAIVSVVAIRRRLR